MVWNTPFWELQNLGRHADLHSPGLFGGYPGVARATSTTSRAPTCVERAERGEAYPVADGCFEDPALLAIEGERIYKQDNFTTLEPVRAAATSTSR